MTEKQKQLELLNELFASSRGDCSEEWSDLSYQLADIIREVGRSPEEAIRELLTDDLTETLVDIYKIPRAVAKSYARATPEFMDNVITRVKETMMFELENWIGSTNILSFQGTKLKEIK